MPRRASWAARIVPDAPPPTIATVVERSDFVIRPILRVGRARLARLDMVVDAGDRPPGSLGEPARNDRVNNRRAPSADQLRADRNGAHSMACPAHPKRARMREEQSIRDPATLA